MRYSVFDHVKVVTFLTLCWTVTLFNILTFGIFAGERVPRRYRRIQ